MNRIIRVKAFYRAAMDILDSGAPFCAGMAISALQDAVEAMAHDAVASVGATIGVRATFIEHWNVLAEKGRGLPYRTEMSELNTARVGFKHQGVNPDIADAEKHAAAARRFLVETAREFFTVDFDALSDSSLLLDPNLQQAVKLAEKALEQEDARVCLEHCRDAMNIVERLMRAATGLHNPALFTPSVPREAEKVMNWAQDRLADIENSVALNILRVNPAAVQILYDSLPQQVVSGKKYWRGQEVTLVCAKTSLRILVDLAFRVERAKSQLERLQRQAGGLAKKQDE